MTSYEEYQKKIDDSLPKWDCAEDYKHLSIESSDDQFAWEFLRRNTEYQQDYYNAFIKKIKGFKFPIHKWGLRERSTKLCPSKNTPPEFYCNRFPIVKFNENKHEILLNYIEKYPHKDEEINYKITRYRKNIKDPEKISLIMKFSVAWDIESQLNTARELLEKHKEFVNYIQTKKMDLTILDKNPNKGGYRDYLRAFDAIYRNKIALKEAAICINHIDPKRSIQSVGSAKKTINGRAQKGYELVYFGYKNILDIGTRSDN